MECRNLVVVRCPVYVRVERIAALQQAGIAAGFQQHDVKARLRQARRDRSAAGSGADDDVIALIVASPESAIAIRAS